MGIDGDIAGCGAIQVNRMMAMFVVLWFAETVAGEEYLLWEVFLYRHHLLGNMTKPHLKSLRKRIIRQFLIHMEGRCQTTTWCDQPAFFWASLYPKRRRQSPDAVKPTHAPLRQRVESMDLPQSEIHQPKLLDGTKRPNEWRCDLPLLSLGPRPKT